MSRPARPAIWIAAAILAAWIYLTGAIQEGRYERRLANATHDERSGLGDESFSTSLPPVRASTDRTGLARRLAVLDGYDRFFAMLAAAGFGIMVAGVSASVFLANDQVRGPLVGGFVFVGLWITGTSLLVRKRLRRYRNAMSRQRTQDATADEPSGGN